MLSELEELDDLRAWPRHFQRLNWEATQRAGTLKIARLPENRQLNRYRDVLPYDHSRIILKEGQPDYINANLVEVPRLKKRYILTQGPLPNTAQHFWQMVWEQDTAVVIMLNRVIEKNQIKCYQYWPCGQAAGHVDQLEFGNFRITFLDEVHNDYFAVRTLELENVVTEEKRSINHFHYLTWPDFGVPTSPATFLAFLFEVRKTGALSNDVGPSVIHCSAGIGRSGTLIMVDSMLTEIEQVGDMDKIDIKETLLEMRKYRLGLIQTPDQLRFTYLAILEGVEVLMPEIHQKAVYEHLQTSGGTSDNIEEESSGAEDDREQDNEQDEETPPPLPPRRRLEAEDEPESKKSRTDDGTSGTSLGADSSVASSSVGKSKSKFRSFLNFVKKRKGTNVDRQSSSVRENPENAAEREVSSESSEGSDEIINLSSLSDSESEAEDDLVQSDDAAKEPSALVREMTEEPETREEPRGTLEDASEKEGVESNAVTSGSTVSVSDHRHVERSQEEEEQFDSDTVTVDASISVSSNQPAEMAERFDPEDVTLVAAHSVKDQAAERSKKVEEVLDTDTMTVGRSDNQPTEISQKVEEQIESVSADVSATTSVGGHQAAELPPKVDEQFGLDRVTLGPTLSAIDKKAVELSRNAEDAAVREENLDDEGIEQSGSDSDSDCIRAVQDENELGESNGGSVESINEHGVCEAAASLNSTSNSFGMQHGRGSSGDRIGASDSGAGVTKSAKGSFKRVMFTGDDTTLDYEKENEPSPAQTESQKTEKGETKDKESETELRRRKREERKRKTSDIVENIKKKIKREEEGQVWKSRLKTTFLVVAACSVAYLAFRYFSSG